MKIQRNVIYILGVLTVISAVIYVSIVLEHSLLQHIENTNCRIVIMNIALGIFCSSFIAAIVAIITYAIERSRNMKLFAKSYKKMFEWCGEYPKGNKPTEKVKWFAAYKELFDEGYMCLSDVAFIFDIRRHKNYLEKVMLYYMDFILLTQNEFLKLKYKDDYSINEIDEFCNRIDSVAVEVETTKKGIWVHNTEYKRLTHNKQFVMKAIYTIYQKPFRSLLSNYEFDQTLVTEKTFCVLDKNDERYLKRMIKEMRIVNSGNIVVEIPEKVCKSLRDKGYVITYSKMANGKMKIDCPFIVDYYFKLKKRFKK